MKESKFQKKLIEELKERFPEALVSKNDSGYIQGIPDITIYYGKTYAMLECKKDEQAPHQPNQEYYVNKINSMSFASFIFPENKEEVLNEMERSFKRNS